MKLLPTWVEGLSPDLVKRARDELGETPEIKAEALLELRKMINEDPEFICPEDDSFLVRFLRVKKFNFKKAFKSLRNYYEFKKRDPGILTDKTRKILDLEPMFIPSQRAPDGAILGIFYTGVFDLRKFSLEDYVSTGILCTEQYAEIEANQVCGCHMICDLKGITLKKMITMASPSFLSQFIKGLEDCWPHRINSITVVNEPFFINVIYNVIWPLLSAKLKERISFIGNKTSLLQKRFPKEILPKRLGGVLGEAAYDEFKQKIIASQLEIERQNKYSFHRVQKPRKKHSTCGLEENSNFKQSNATAISNAAN